MLLRWIARFRFVDANVLALNAGVSRQQVNARLRGLGRAGLVTRAGTPGGTTGWTVSATRRGMGALGLEPRRPARTDVQREHELALAWLVTRLEARGDTVRTERESRRLERMTGIRHSADIVDPGGRSAKRWPDLILERPDGGRAAIELERTPKGATRVRRILEGYRRAPWFDEVRLLCCEPQVARILASALRVAEEPLPGLEPARNGPAITIAAWPALAAGRKRAIDRALARPR